MPSPPEDQPLPGDVRSGAEEPPGEEHREDEEAVPEGVQVLPAYVAAAGGVLRLQGAVPEGEGEDFHREAGSELPGERDLPDEEHRVDHSGRPLRGAEVHAQAIPDRRAEVRPAGVRPAGRHRPDAHLPLPVSAIHPFLSGTG